MGHQDYTGPLPRTRKWNEVIELIATGGGAPVVASATIDAVDSQLSSAAFDPALVRTVWLLTQLPDAAKTQRFRDALYDLGIEVPEAPTTLDLSAALSQALDRHVERSKFRSNVAEMAQHAAIEALTTVLHDRTQSLFGTTPQDVQNALSTLGTEKRFGALVRDFFARFIQRSLAYFVGRELPVHVGEKLRFKNLAEQQAFAVALELHCRQASRIVEVFAGQWYEKTRYEKQLTEARTAGFVGYALKKLKAELRMGAAA